MADFVFIAVPLGFFGLCVAYVRALDRMLRGDDTSTTAGEGRR